MDKSQMMQRLILFTLAIVLSQSAWGQAPVRPRDIVQATVRINNPKSTATGFVLVLPKGETAGEGKEAPERFALITSAHVLEAAAGDDITVLFHRPAETGDFARAPQPYKIRKDGKPLWAQHPKQDVAALKIEVPKELALPRLESEILIAEPLLKVIEPGDLVRCAVFPHGVVFDPSPASFPTIRLGCIASYPLVPIDTQRMLLVDYNVFEGDSGGPVYWQGTDEQGKPALKILGLVKGQHWINQRYELTYSSGEFRKQLGLAQIEQAQTIRETLSLIPRE